MSNEVLHALAEFGLTSLQSRVYLALLALGTSRASKVGYTIGIVRPEAYRILRELSFKGLVQGSPETPTTFTATPPGDAIPLLLDQFENKLTSLQQQKSALLKSLAASSHLETHTKSQQRFNLIGGRKAALSKVKQVISDAKYDYVAIISKDGLRRLKDWGFAAAILDAKERKVRVRLISEIDDSNFRVADSISRYVALRQSNDLLFYLSISDKKQMVLGPALSDEELNERNLKEVDLWTNSDRFILGMYALFESLWRSSFKYSRIRNIPRIHRLPAP